LDDELKEALKAELPENVPYVFFSSHNGTGLVELKDMLWRALNKPE
jgi:GTP-binding protein